MEPLVGAAHRRVHGLLQVAADEAHVLPDLEKDHGDAGVLAEGAALALGDLRVLEQLVEDRAAGAVAFEAALFAQGRPLARVQHETGLLDAAPERVPDGLDRDLSHTCPKACTAPGPV